MCPEQGCAASSSTDTATAERLAILGESTGQRLEEEFFGACVFLFLWFLISEQPRGGHEHPAGTASRHGLRLQLSPHQVSFSLLSVAAWGLFALWLRSRGFVHTTELFLINTF